MRPASKAESKPSRLAIGACQQQPSGDPLPERYYLQIECRDEADQRELYERFRRERRRVRVITL